MPERDTPNDGSNALSGDLFANLPAPSHKVPSVDYTPPSPGSRRARREATQSDAASDTAASADESSSAADVADEPPLTPTAAASSSTTPKAAPASLDDLFQTEHDIADGARPRKKKRRTGCLVALIIVLALIGGAVAAGFWAMNTYGDKINEVMGWGEPEDWEPGLASGEALVTIREGDTGAPVSAALYEAGVTKTKDVFYDYLVKENVAVTFYPGVYTLQKKMTAAAALDALRDPANKSENTVGISEGGTVESSLTAISEGVGLPIEEVQAAVADPRAYGVEADSLEGWLFPAVYTFDPEVTATQVIQRMVDRTRESLTAAGVPAADEQRILTLASIIQREGRTDDFGKVSRVIQNRLADGMMLQMDSTAQYGYGELHAGVVSTSSEAQFDDNPWNTYVHAGLPIGPIANPSDAAIDAAMHPVDGPWFYFVTINPQTGETVFSTTYAEHQAAITTWQDWCRANPDQGC
ncbi:ABC transporter substrate-binding protein [Microbacterium sp. CH12i]|uniref:endolytic transglycosylase MltG n=1 Tax=Microbacterium sp. CH12i TaxID=1479651 RepID=UPI000460F199|nr:endolytic transglycosylase MltG [Microbacterium sp. CH12i]KDA05650.1 ABC transporter substrate-binding protein [Microbacterium sp. CH12i]